MVTQAYDHPRPATRFDGGSWTGRELLDRAAGAAQWLDSLGLPPGTEVPALVATSAEAMALVIGGAGSGRPLAPLGVRMTAREIAAVLEPMRSPVVIAQLE